MQIPCLTAWIIGVSLVSGCTPLKGTSSKSILWLDYDDPYELAAQLGYTAAPSSAHVTRDSVGEHLFLQLQDTTGQFRLATISSRGVQLKELRGPSSLDDAGDPVWWFERTVNGFQFAGHFQLSTNIHPLDCEMLCNGKYIAVRSSHTNKWVAEIATPSTVLVALPQYADVQLIVCRGNRLHIFYDDLPNGSTRGPNGSTRGRETVLHYEEYQIDGNSGRLLMRRQFDWTRQIYDFDLDDNLMLVRSLSIYFPHAWLANVDTGMKKRLGSARMYGLFVKDQVAQEFRNALKEPAIGGKGEDGGGDQHSGKTLRQ
jgi:hypothetical protein